MREGVTTWKSQGGFHYNGIRPASSRVSKSSPYGKGRKRSFKERECQVERHGGPREITCSGRDKGKFKISHRFKTYSFSQWGVWNCCDMVHGLDERLDPQILAGHLLYARNWRHRDEKDYPTLPLGGELDILTCFQATSNIWTASQLGTMRTPGTSTCDFMFGLGTCPSYPICWSGTLLFCLTLFHLSGLWCQLWITHLHVDSSVLQLSAFPPWCWPTALLLWPAAIQGIAWVLLKWSLKVGRSLFQTSGPCSLYAPPLQM